MKPKPTSPNTPEQFNINDGVDSPQLSSNSTKLLIRIRVERSRKHRECLRADVKAVEALLEGRSGRADARIEALETCKRDLQALIREEDPAKLLTGPLQGITNTKLLGCGALSHLAILVGMMCVGKTGTKRTELSEALEVVQNEKGYKRFVNAINPEAAAIRAKAFLQCLDLARTSIASEKAKTRHMLEGLLREIVEETGLSAQTQGLQSRRDDELLDNTLVSSFTTKNQKCDEGGRGDYDRRWQAVRIFNKALLRLRR